MEIVFENNYTRNKDTAKELYRYLYFQKPLFIVLDIFLAFTFVINVVYIFIGEAYNLSILIGNPIVFKEYICEMCEIMPLFFIIKCNIGTTEPMAVT